MKKVGMTNEQFSCQSNRNYYTIYMVIVPLIFASLNAIFPVVIPTNINVPSCYNTPSRNYFPTEIFIDQDTEFRNTLIKVTKTSFNNYVKYCLGYDEFRPYSKQCLNYYGISATLIESLETLYMLNMTKEYEFSRDFILNNYSIPGEVDNHEFFSRGIASLIGIYQLTGDKRFLVKAAQITDSVIYSNSNNILENQKNISKKQILSEWLSGIPELIILNEFFPKPIYQTLIDNAIKGKLSNFVYPIENDKPIFNFAITSFVRNSLIITDILHDADITRPLLSHRMLKRLDISKMTKYLLKSFKKFPPKSPINLTYASQMIPIINEFPQTLIDSLENPKRFGDERHMTGFHFSGDELLGLALRSKFDIIKKTILNSFKTYKYGDGYSGTTTTSCDNSRPDDIQHTEFLGEWIKVGALISTGYHAILNHTIFNEFGHILKIRK